MSLPERYDARGLCIRECIARLDIYGDLESVRVAPSVFVDLSLELGAGAVVTAPKECNNCGAPPPTGMACQYCGQPAHGGLRMLARANVVHVRSDRDISGRMGVARYENGHICEVTFHD